MPFAPIHIYGSTYNRKIAELMEAQAFIESEGFGDNPNHGLRRIDKDQCRDRHAQ